MRDTTWSPGRGIIRALAAGLVAAVFVALALTPVAVFAPALLMNAVCRAATTFGVAWIIFAVVYSAAGMVGRPLTSIAVVYSLVAMLSNHVVWAVFGARVGDGGEVVAGWQYWFNPMVLVFPNIFVAISLTFCAALFRDGVPGSDLFSYLSTLPVWGSGRS